MFCRKLVLCVVGVVLVAVFSARSFAAEERTAETAAVEAVQQETTDEGTGKQKAAVEETAAAGVKEQLTEDKMMAILLEEKVESYKAAVENQKSANKTIIGMIGILAAVFGFIVFKQSRDYKEAVAEAKAAARDAEAAGKEAVREVKTEVKDAIKEMKAESKAAVKDVKEAEKEARNACDKAQGWEEKAQEKFKEIDKEVEEKLREIDKRTDKKIEEVESKIKKARNASVKRISDEGEKQREISRLWDEATKTYHEKEYEKACKLWEQITEKDEKNKWRTLSNWGIALCDWAEISEVDCAEDKFKQACEKCAEAVKIKPDYHVALSNWGAALAGWARLPGVDGADEKLKQACEKCAAALKVKPDDYKAIANWGVALMGLAVNETGTEREDLLDEAIEKFMAVEKIKQGEEAYNLGCAYALKGDVDECRKWLVAGQAAGVLPTKEHAMKDDDLTSVRDEEWFKALKWEQ